MRFSLRGQHNYYDMPEGTDRPPIKGAVLGALDVWDFRTFKSPEEHDEKLCDRADGFLSSEPWLSEGTNHKIIVDHEGKPQGIGRIRRTVPAWFIEIKTLEELMTIVNEIGAIDVGPSDADPEHVMEISYWD